MSQNATSYAEIEAAISETGSISAAQKALSLRYGQEQVPEGFDGEGVSIFGFRVSKVSGTGIKEMNGEKDPYNADRTMYYIFQAFYEKSGVYKIDIHDAITDKKIGDLDVNRFGSSYFWHPSNPFFLCFVEGAELKAVHVMTRQISLLKRFSKTIGTGGGDGNHPDEFGNMVLGTKKALFVYSFPKGKVISETQEYDPGSDFPTFNPGDIDYAQAFAGKVVLNMNSGGILLANLDFKQIGPVLHRRGVHMEMGYWPDLDGAPGVAIVRHNDKDAEFHQTESGRSYVVTWDKENNLTWHPGDKWPMNRLGGHTGGQASWTENGLFVALHSTQEYQQPHQARANEVFQIIPGGHRRMVRHGINKAYPASSQPEVKDTLFKGPDGWYRVHMTPPAPLEAVQHFIETGEIPNPMPVVEEPDPTPEPVVEEPNPTPEPAPIPDYEAAVLNLQEKIRELQKAVSKAMSTWAQALLALPPGILDLAEKMKELDPEASEEAQDGDQSK